MSRIQTNKNVKNVKNASKQSKLQNLEDAWASYSPGVFTSLKVEDLEVIELARQAYLAKAKSPTEAAVRAFIDTQLKATPPHEYFDFEKDWPEGGTL